MSETRGSSALLTASPLRQNRIRKVNRKSRPITKTNFAFYGGENIFVELKIDLADVATEIK